MAQMPQANQIPSLRGLLNPVLSAIRTLGGSATVAEIESQVIKDLNLSDVALQSLGGNGQTVLYNRLASTRSELKKRDLIDYSARGVWAFTSNGLNAEIVDPGGVPRVANEYDRIRRQGGGVEQPAFDPEAGDDLSPDSDPWRADLLEALRSMPPAAFERLCQRLLREAGFEEVVVTGRPGDGGIDGRGLIRLSGLISFSVVFQCKRYSGSVGPGAVQTFQGAVQGQADRGMFLTTGTFTSSARQAATRPGAVPIDLIDGELLLDKLKELRLGVKVTPRMVEDVEVDTPWFNAL